MAEPKLKEMTERVAVNRYERPRGFWIVIPIAVGSTFVAFSLRSNFEPGSLLFDSLLQSVPSFASFCHQIQPYLITMMWAIHVFEAAYMSSTRLYPHHVAPSSKLFWKWTLSAFFEGIGSFKRFDNIVKCEEELKHPRSI